MRHGAKTITFGIIILLNNIKKKKMTIDSWPWIQYGRYYDGKKVIILYRKPKRFNSFSSNYNRRFSRKIYRRLIKIFDKYTKIKQYPLDIRIGSKIRLIIK